MGTNRTRIAVDPDTGCSFSSPQCERAFHSFRDEKPYCKTHYEMARTGRPLAPIRPKIAAGTYPGCTFKYQGVKCKRAHSSSGYCATHYQQWNDGKELTPIRSWVSQAEWGPTCRYPGCDANYHSRGLCIVHYGRGISQFARDALLALQGGVCLCGTDDPGELGWHLDHFHGCMAGHKPENYCPACARGMLCMQCNRHGVAWYEETYKRFPDNPVFSKLESWINRRVVFEGEVDSPDVTVRRVDPAD